MASVEVIARWIVRVHKWSKRFFEVWVVLTDMSGHRCHSVEGILLKAAASKQIIWDVVRFITSRISLSAAMGIFINEKYNTCWPLVGSMISTLWFHSKSFCLWFIHWSGFWGTMLSDVPSRTRTDLKDPLLVANSHLRFFRSRFRRLPALYPAVRLFFPFSVSAFHPVSRSSLHCVACWVPALHAIVRGFRMNRSDSCFCSPFETRFAVLVILRDGCVAFKEILSKSMTHLIISAIVYSSKPLRRLMRQNQHENKMLLFTFTYQLVVLYWHRGNKNTITMGLIVACFAICHSTLPDRFSFRRYLQQMSVIVDFHSFLVFSWKRCTCLTLALSRPQITLSECPSFAPFDV